MNMLHRPILSRSFVVHNPAVLKSQLIYSDSNYVPVYSIKLPEYQKAIWGERELEDNTVFTDDNCTRITNNLMEASYYQTLYNASTNRWPTFNYDSFIEYLKLNPELISHHLKTVIQRWLEDDVDINSMLLDRYNTITYSTIARKFFEYNVFTGRMVATSGGSLMLNYGFLGRYKSSNEITPRIVLMTKKENVLTVKKCFAFNRPFPLDIFELWIAPDLSVYEKRLLEGLKPYIVRNGWKVIKYNGEGILSRFNIPVFKSIRERNDFDLHTWENFCHSDINAISI